MATLSTLGSNTFIPDIFNRNAGLSLGDGDDFLSPNTIADIGNGFVSSVNPVTSNNRPVLGDVFSSPFSHNASVDEILLGTTYFTQGINPVQSGDPTTLVRLPYLQLPFLQPVPDFGENPNAAAVLSASTQFQQDLRTVGPPIRSGFPFLTGNPTPQQILLGTAGYGQSVLSGLPTGGMLGSGMNPFYTHMGYWPGMTSGQTGFPGMSYYWPGMPTGQPTVPPTIGTMSVVNAVRNSTTALPDILPGQSPQQTLQLIQAFNQLPEYLRVLIRQNLANPTTVNETILNQTGITSTGGAFNQGTVTNPFNNANFLTDTNPFQRFGTGMTVTNGNGNGKVKGTPMHDILMGTQDRNNIIDGRGGEDDILGSSRNDLVNLYQGDRASTGAGDDLMFFDFTGTGGNAFSQTIVDGGQGNDTMVLTVGGNPTQAASTPTFTRLANGFISVTLNGMQFLAANMEKFIVVDQAGNIGGTYQVNAQQ